MPTFNRRSLLLLAAAATTRGTGVLAATNAPAVRSPSARNIRGKILYTGDDGKERGREWFGFSFREDGQITLRAYCEIDDARVERDVVYTMTSQYHPLDCFVRLHVGGKFLGTGWIRVSDTEAECEVFNTSLGRVHQLLPLSIPAPSLGAHPLSCDVLLLPSFDHAKAERIQSIPGSLSTSPLLDGASGPLLAVHTAHIEYVGLETITTPAGRFQAHHYRFPPDPAAPLHPSGTPRSEDIWCTEPDFIFVRAEVHGYLRNASGYGRYELVELES